MKHLITLVTGAMMLASVTVSAQCTHGSQCCGNKAHDGTPAKECCHAAPAKLTLKATTDTLTVPTANLATPMRVSVCVPEGYLAEGDTTTYPTLYVLNGYTGNYRDYVTKMNMDSLANAYGMILVMPDGRDSWYWDAPMDSTMRMETFFVNDLVPYIDANLRTRPCRCQRAITGLSMGGQGAMYLALRHKDIWGSAGTMSGGVDITRPKFHNSWKMKRWLGEYDKYPERWQERAIVNLVPTLKPGELNIVMSCGDKDFFLEANNDLDARLTKAGIRHDYHVTPGDHSWPYWRKALPVQLEFFRKQFDGKR